MLRAPPGLPTQLPWDLAELGKAPRFEWLESEGPVRSLLYSGPPFRGRPTRVFAYWATPATLDTEKSDSGPFPTVVLAHGGGGTAFAQWVELWARRGYAAIAMDLAGQDADRRRLPDGGPLQTDTVKFDVERDSRDAWTYHAVADIILAHSLVRSFDDVDAERTALTGISWGGYLTCIVAGLDGRFRAAVPVYGCGFFLWNSFWMPRFQAMSPPERTHWDGLWDPRHYIGQTGTPVFFISGTNDFAFWLRSWARTCDRVLGARNLRMTVRMPHDHHSGWAPREIGRFIDHHLLGAPALPRVGRPWIEAGRARAEVVSVSDIERAHLAYTTDSFPSPLRRWSTQVASTVDGRLLAPAPPAEARVWFLAVEDALGSSVSSELVFRAERPSTSVTLVPAADFEPFHTESIRPAPETPGAAEARGASATSSSLPLEETASLARIDEGRLLVDAAPGKFLSTRRSWADYRLVLEYRALSLPSRSEESEPASQVSNRERDASLLFHVDNDARLGLSAVSCRLTGLRRGRVSAVGEAALASAATGGFPTLRRTHSLEAPQAARREDADAEGWTRLVVIARGDSVRVEIDGRVFHEGVRVRPAAGQLALRAGMGGRLIVRRLELAPLPSSH